MSTKQVTPQWIDTDTALAPVIDELLEVDRYALDTEFHRERTYFPRLALLQLAWEPGRLVLIDPLKVDLHPFAQVFATGSTSVIHAASQDLEVLQLACGAIPENVFDTQTAAGFAGFSTPSLALLHERFLDVKLPKGDRLTDWLHRPLGDSVLDYAADDVRRLLEIQDLLIAKLESSERLKWAIGECEEQRQRSFGQRDPEQAWRRVKEARHLTGRATAIAQSVGAWRERRAAELDIPVRFVLGDLALVGVSQHPPASVAALKSVRGLDARNLSGNAGSSLLEAIERGKKAEPPKPLKRRDPQIDKELRPAVSLVSSWLAQYSHELQIDAAILATRHDIEELLAGAPDARLRSGWRAELVGQPVAQLLAGDAALAFDRKRGIVLEPRATPDRSDHGSESTSA